MQEREQRLDAVKSRLEQAKIDTQCEVATFEASKDRETEREIAQLQNQRQHALQRAEIELQ
jgi:hypothetical protein